MVTVWLPKSYKENILYFLNEENILLVRNWLTKTQKEKNKTDIKEELVVSCDDDKKQKVQKNKTHSSYII